MSKSKVELVTGRGAYLPKDGKLEVRAATSHAECTYS